MSNPRPMHLLICGNDSYTIAKKYLLELALFSSDPELFNEPYLVKSCVNSVDFALFLDAVCELPVEVKMENTAGLTELCVEFGFRGLAHAIDEFMRITHDNPYEQPQNDQELHKCKQAVDDMLKMATTIPQSFQCTRQRLTDTVTKVMDSAADVEKQWRELSVEEQLKRLS